MLTGHSFPYSKSIWVLTINQLTTDTLLYPPLPADISTRNKNIRTLILGSGVNELNVIGDHTSYIQQTIDACHVVFPKLENIYFFYTNIYFDNNLLTSSCNLTITHLPYFLLRSSLTDTSQFKEWTVGNGKAIFLIGDIRNRIHKFPLLYHFYKNNQLDKLDYSLTDDHYTPDTFFNNDNTGTVVTILDNCFHLDHDIKSFKELFYSLKRSFNEDESFTTGPYVGLNRYTHNYPSTWNDATCNLVVESTFYGSKTYFNREILNGQQEFFFSEKIWKPILAGKPFITISENDLIYSVLEDMGFRTFLRYTGLREHIDLPVLVNNHIEFIELSKNLYTYINLCYDRTTRFLKNAHMYENEIREDVNHNKRHWKKLCDRSWADLFNKCPILRRMTKAQFCELFNHGPDFSMLKISKTNNKD
jgi:hypothetical protein